MDLDGWMITEAVRDEFKLRAVDGNDTEIVGIDAAGEEGFNELVKKKKKKR